MSASADEVMTKLSNKKEGLIQQQELQFVKKLGHGRFGIVYQGIWRMVDIAIKELPPEKLTAESAEEFETEAQTMQRLRHPNIVQVYGYCVSPKYRMVMEYMPNGSLFQLLHNKQAVPWELRIKIAMDMAKGLMYLHKEDIVHRDIKSLNVLLDENFKAKLTDFGLAKVKTETRAIAAKSVQSVGTVPWMAPELFARRAVCTKKSDIYSLGMTFWELASRKIPFRDATSPALIPGWVKGGEREEIPKDCPAKLASLIQACWNEAPDNRPDATAVAEFLVSKETYFSAFLWVYRSHSTKNQAVESQGHQSSLNSAAVSKNPTIPSSSSSSSGYCDTPYPAAANGSAGSNPIMLSPGSQQKLQIIITKPAAPLMGTDVLLLEQEAAQGKVDAIRELGVLYGFGIGVQANKQKSADCFIQSAKRGDEYAKGMCFYYGYNAPQDYRKAATCYQRAAESGYAPAQSALAWHYAEGHGVHKDEKQAHELWLKAAGQGFAPAQFSLGVRYSAGQGIAKDERAAVEWSRKAAEQGHAKAQYNLGVFYAMGQGVPKNEGLAVEWYRKAADQGLAKAQYSLGLCYGNGQGVVKHERLAMEWYRKAADQGLAKAQYSLGLCYDHGRGIAKNERIALTWYRKAAEQGHAHAQLNLGVDYVKGQGTAKNERLAVQQGYSDTAASLERPSN